MGVEFFQGHVTWVTSRERGRRVTCYFNGRPWTGSIRTRINRRPVSTDRWRRRTERSIPCCARSLRWFGYRAATRGRRTCRGVTDSGKRVTSTTVANFCLTRPIDRPSTLGGLRSIPYRRDLSTIYPQFKFPTWISLMSRTRERMI